MAAGLAPELSVSKYAELFARESREQLRQARAALAALSAAPAAGEVDALFRSVHTIKGMAAAMGYAVPESVAHALEDALGHLRDDGGIPDVALRSRLTAGFELLDDAVESSIDPDRTTCDLGTAGDLLAALSASGQSSTKADPALARDVVVNRSPAARDTTSRSVESPTSVRVDAAALDRLLDLASEVGNVRGRLAAVAAHSGDAALARAIADLGRASGALTGEVQSARLVRLAELLADLPRVVRQAARATDKRVTLDTSGGEISADRAVIDALAEPLIHLLRNAVDHGIESPAERVRAGKSETGRVAVRVARDGNALVIEVEDDGRGVDRAGVVARARAHAARGSHGTDARTPFKSGSAGEDLAVDDATLLDYLALPGLSTAGAVGRLSGRGVGVDAALARIRALGGSLALRTESGVGTCFTLRMPLGWAIVPALLVRAGGTAYALPLVHVRGTRERTNGDEQVPSLAALLAGGHDAVHQTSSPLEVVLLAAHGGTRVISVAIDTVIGARDCVLKPVAAPRGAYRIAAGATILDGGEVALMLDVPALAARPIPSAPAATPLPVPGHPVPLASAVPTSGSTTYRSDDPRTLNAVQRDALREVANIGAGHAATALSQMTGSPIMISVPTVHVAPLGEIAPQLAPSSDLVAAVLMDVMGDLTGRTLLVLPKPTVLRLAERMLRRPVGASVALGEMERSALKEAGNILSGAYLNALSDFMGLVILPSPPTLAIDRATAVLTPSFLRIDAAAEYVFVVETEFVVQDVEDRLHGFFLLLPDPPSLRLILRAARVD